MLLFSQRFLFGLSQHFIRGLFSLLPDSRPASLTSRAGFLKSRAKYAAQFRLLYENNHPQVMGVHVRRKLDLNVLAERLSLLKLSDLDEFLKD